MPEPTMRSQPPDAGAALRDLILERAQAINVQLLTQLSTVTDDLARREPRATLGGLDGLERQIHIMRSFLLLLG